MTDTTSTPIAHTVASLPGSAAERFSANIAARYRDGEQWKEVTYAEAVSAAGAVIVPVYPTNSPKECEWVVGNSAAKAIICEDKGQRQKIDLVRDALPELEYVIGIEQGAGDMTLDELRDRGAGGDRVQLAARQEKVQREDAWIIIYTSGTTGPPKAVVLTHANALPVCHIVEELEFVS